MATPPQLVQMAFAAGLDESQQGEVLDPMAGFAVLQNVRQDKRGGLSKRLGYASLGQTVGGSSLRLDSTLRAAGNRLCTHKDALCTIDGTYLDSYLSTLQVSAVRSRVPEAGVTTRTLAAVATSGGLYDIVLCNGYIATCTLRDAVHVSVGVEDTAGVVIRAPETVFTTTVTETSATLLTYSTYIILLASDSTTGDVAAYYLNTASAATLTTGWVSIGNVATDKATTGVECLALSGQSLTNRVAFAYVNDSGGVSQVTVKTMTIAGVVETATVNTNSVTPSCVAVEGSIADTLWVSWNETTAIRLMGLDADALAVTLATTATILTVTTSPGASAPFIQSSTTAGAGRLAVNDGTSSLWRVRGFATNTGAVVTSGADQSIRGAKQTTRPFLLGGRYYAVFTNGEARVAILCDYTDVLTSRWLRPVASVFPNLSHAPGFNALHPQTLSATTVAVGIPVVRSALASCVELITYDFADEGCWAPASHNGSTFFSGGLLSYFDGRRVAEASFLYAPKTPTAADSAGGSGVTGPVRYVATYEEVDADGNWCISGVSTASAELSITDNEATVTVEPLAISGRLSATADPRVRVALYRTLQGAEPPYYFVTSTPNDTSGVLTFTDGFDDATLSTARKLYAPNLPGVNGDAQDRRAPPYARHLVSYNGMLVIATGSELWWSGQTISGEGTWFTPAFYVPIDGPGEVTAVAVQDGTLYVFKRKAVFALAGEAPSDNGASGGLGSPRRLAVDVGCLDWRSVVATSLGIFFLSERGIELLTRSGAVQWIGEAVQTTLASFPVVSSAVLDDRNGLVRFSLAASESGGRVSGNGRDLVYDLSLGTWQSVDDKSGVSAHEASQDAAMLYVDGLWRYGWLGTDGTIYYERLSSDGSAYLDGSTWITMSAETAWLKLGGIQGRHHVNKVLLLARKSTRADLNTYLSYDYATTSKTVMTRAANDIDTLSTAIDRIQVEHQLHDEAEGQAIKVKFEDATPTGGTVSTGKGATWIALTFEGVPKQGAADLPEAGM